MLTWIALSLASWAAMSARDLCSMMRSAVSLSPSACTMQTCSLTCPVSDESIRQGQMLSKAVTTDLLESFLKGDLTGQATLIDLNLLQVLD